MRPAVTLPLYQVDAFTDAPFRGNPAAVCLLERTRDDAWLQSVAAEMNLAETAFLLPRSDGYDLRWFTPACEVDLCGHATLASAHILWETGRLPHEATARFLTRSGWLTAARRAGLIELDFPSTPPESAPEAIPALSAAIGAPVRWAGRSRFDMVAELADAAAVRHLTPDLAQIRHLGTRGLIVTAIADAGGHDFVSRYFAPQFGIDEDPVTGSAHCALGPHWAAKLGRTTLVGYQASRRGGTVHVRLAGDRVLLGGHGVTVLRGELVA
jgi:PhzF family phenazine biosynthesis protein